MPIATIVISGGGTGIGAATARHLHREGKHVTVVGRRPEPLEKLAAELGDRVAVVDADLSTPPGVERVAEAVADTPCAGIVAAAGGVVPAAEPGLEQTRQSWQAAFESNVLTAVLLVEALRPALYEAGGRVVLLSSIAALRGSFGGPYGAMKSALHAWVFDLARDLGSYGGTANAIAPGFVPDTEFWEGRLTEEAIARRTAPILVGRPGTPAEVASLIAWLLGPDGGWVTAQILSPNGGAVLGR